MSNKKLSLIDELTSPLQRMMWIYNADEPKRRIFENNICTFHVGNGYFLSVAHNLRLQAGYYRSIDEAIYKKELLPILDGSQTRFLDQHYFTDEYTHRKHLNNADPATLQTIANILKQKRFDTRWVTLAQKNICTPHVLFEFKKNAFYNDESLTHLFDENRIFFDNGTKKYTFLVEVELVKAFYSADIALYRIKTPHPLIISKIPTAAIDYDFLDEDTEKFYCLQSSPSSTAGRLLNTARIEGMLDHFNIFPDDVAGNYQMEGYRYLIKGYFRFGSSGAPYLFYDRYKDEYLVNAIQSEASGVQLSIKNEKEGNYQYVNAIATPLSLIKNELEEYLK